jgi:hypothetical protein
MKTARKLDPYRHLTVDLTQASKRAGQVCGDFIAQDRTTEATTVILCDGIGSGVRADLAARMCAARLRELLHLGFSLRDACERVTTTMHEARSRDIPFAAFTVVRMLNDGETTVLTYETPPPLLIQGLAVSVLEPHFMTRGIEVMGESQTHLRPGDSLFVTSDGVSQAGLGVTHQLGWTMTGARDFTARCLDEGMALAKVPGAILEEVRRLTGGVYGDDTSIVRLSCRAGATVHIMTGPSPDPAKDEQIVDSFLEAEGTKVVCGSVTAEIAARQLGVHVTLASTPVSAFEPPCYEIPGIDLATEGAVTLNQTYNVIDMDPRDLEPEAGVTRLCRYLHAADRVHFWLGGAINQEQSGVMFRQIGVLPRTTIVPLLAEKLRQTGKLVVIHEI